MIRIKYADLYAIQSQKNGEDWVNHKVFFTDKYKFLLEELESEIQRVHPSDARYRILCLSSNLTLYEVVRSSGWSSTSEG
jgi:hypothetical protein